MKKHPDLIGALRTARRVLQEFADADWNAAADSYSIPGTPFSNSEYRKEDPGGYALYRRAIDAIRGINAVLEKP